MSACARYVKLPGLSVDVVLPCLQFNLFGQWASSVYRKSGNKEFL